MPYIAAYNTMTVLSAAALAPGFPSSQMAMQLPAAEPVAQDPSLITKILEESAPSQVSHPIFNMQRRVGSFAIKRPGSEAETDDDLTQSTDLGGSADDTFSQLQQHPEWQALLKDSTVSSEALNDLASVLVAVHQEIRPILNEQDKILTLRDLIRSVDVVAHAALKQGAMSVWEAIEVTVAGQFGDAGVRERLGGVVEDVRSRAVLRDDSNTVEVATIRQKIRAVLAREDITSVEDVYRSFAGMTLETYLGLALRKESIEVQEEMIAQLSWDTERIVNWVGQFKVRGGLRYVMRALGDAEVAFFAVNALGELGDPAARVALESVLKDAEMTVRGTAAHALAKLGDSAAREALESALGDDGVFVRIAAAKALGELGDPLARVALEKVLADKSNDAFVREAAAEALGKLGDPAAREALKAALGDPFWQVRQSAAYALGKLGDPAAARVALEKELGDPDGEVRKAAAKALGRLGDPAAWVALKAVLLRDGSANARRAAAEALGRLGDPASREVLKAALGDRVKCVRQSAAEALARLGDPAVREALEVALAYPGNQYVRQAAAEALGELGDPASREALEAALGDPEMHVRKAAAEALGKLGDPLAREALEKALRDASFFPREAAAKALGELGDPAAQGSLKTALSDPNKVVREAAVQALDTVAPDWDREIRKQWKSVHRIVIEEVHGRTVAAHHSQIAAEFAPLLRALLRRASNSFLSRPVCVMSCKRSRTWAISCVAKYGRL